LLLAILAGGIAFFTTCLSIDAAVTALDPDPYASLRMLRPAMSISLFVGLSTLIVVIVFFVRRSKREELQVRAEQERRENMKKKPPVD
jgi:membrane protein implicated in regulation of membrane protease activity